MNFLRRLSVPASESHLGLALGLSMVIMAMLLCAVLWQSNIIVTQRDLIRWLWNLKTGG
jgi:hypothetical protein